MLHFLEIGAGVVLGVSAIGIVFWLTFRHPPRRRVAEDSTSMNPNAEYMVHNLRDDGHGGYF